MEDCKAIGVPLVPKIKLKEECEQGWWDSESSLSTSSGILDVCHVVYFAGFGIPNKRGLHMANPSLEHWIAIKCIFRYLESITTKLLHLLQSLC
jgi:hypothetical protein